MLTRLLNLTPSPLRVRCLNQWDVILLLGCEEICWLLWPKFSGGVVCFQFSSLFVQLCSSFRARYAISLSLFVLDLISQLIFQNPNYIIFKLNHIENFNIQNPNYDLFNLNNIQNLKIFWHNLIYYMIF